MNLGIEVAVSKDISTTAQGNLLENLVSEILQVLQYSTDTNVRVSGMEVDLIARHNISGEKVYVECKAYRDTPLSADTLTKLLGNVIARDVSSGWLFTTGVLGKDAKGFLEDWDGKPSETRRQLQVYGAESLVNILMTTGRCVKPEKLQLIDGYKYADEAIFLVSDIGRFWAIPTIHSVAGVWQGVLYFNSDSVTPISDQAILNKLAKIKSSVADLTALVGATTKAIPKIKSHADAIVTEFENIVAVSVAEKWSDYRPARAEDFVGRIHEQEMVFEFFDNVRTGKTRNRLLATKGPSGWGKSSFLNKLVSRCHNKKNLNKIFMYAVDCRTAVSSRYAELALKKCLDEARRTGFLGNSLEPITIGGASNPFADTSTQEVLTTLKQEKKLIVLFFDQFEEITNKVELEDLFKCIQSLCFAVDAAQENVILGFSWKTDGTVPQDHPAYHTWHNLADRRFEIELSRFSSAEISQALTRFSKEIKQEIKAPIRRLLNDHCQGYPWLLKKLCIHVFTALSKKNVDQVDILNKALNVHELFRRDIAELSATEIGCIKRVAEESPAEFFQIENAFGGNVVRKLIDMRLVIRSASKLILYWDIFRDYVLTGRVPAITGRYLPKINIGSTKAAIEVLLQSSKRSSSLKHLESKLGIKPGTADNIARDLLMLGIAEYSRKDGQLELIHSSELETIEAIHNFFTNHIVVKTLVAKSGGGFKIRSDDLPRILGDIYHDSDFAEKTWAVYSRVFTGWLKAFRIVVTRAGEIEHTQETKFPRSFSEIAASFHSGKKLLFIGQAPPNRVIDTVRRMLAKEPITIQDRNSLNLLRTMELIASISEPTLLETPPNGMPLENWIASVAFSQSVLEQTWAPIEENPLISHIEIGALIEKIKGNPLSDASKQRYGNSIAIWHKWIKQTAV
jgi:hypothetical protein